MKKNVILVGIVAALCSCNNDIYDNIKELVDSEAVYPAAYKQAHVQARAGDKRVVIDLYPGRPSVAEMEKILPKAKKTVVEYGDTLIRIDSLCSWVSIPNLTIPRTYRFLIYTENNEGDKSIPVEARQKPFTEADKGALVFTATASASVSTGIVNIAKAPDIYEICRVRYSYPDKNDVTQSDESMNNVFVLNNLKAGALTVANLSCYLLPKEAVDTLWVDGTVDVKTIAQEVLDAYFTATQPFPTGSQHILSAITPCEFNGGDFDIGGQDLSYNKQDQVYHDNATYRPAGGDPINKVCIWANATTNASWWYGVAWVTAGDWVVYTLEVQAAGNYQIEVYKAGDAGTASCDIDYMNYWGTFSLPNSGWNTGISAEIGTVYLGVGKHKMKWTFVGGNFALLGFKFTKV